MIKINLLPQKRAKRGRVQAGPSESPRDFLIGCAALAGAALVVFFAVDQPKRSHLKDLVASNNELQGQINSKNAQLIGYAELRKSADEADTRAASINRLLAAKVVPANVLQELGEVLTMNHLPTMTEDMAKRTGNGPESDPNKRFDLAWDPAHVWLLGFIDKGDGRFFLDGGAAAEFDVTQLAKRLQASVYFSEVAPATEDRVTDRENGIEYFRFTITGKVAY
jgi:hypothetical protein